MKKTGIVLSILTAVIISGVPQALYAADTDVASPDGRTVFSIQCTDGKPVYTISLDGKDFIAPSPLGLRTNIGDFTSGLSLTAVSPVESVKDSYSLPNIKRSNVNYNASHREYSFADSKGDVFDLIVEVSDNNVAFRYRLKPIGETLCCVIDSEATGFVMPEGATTFLCPQSGPMGGFARTSPSYETPYTPDGPVGENGWGNGYTFPCLFRNGDNGWTLISETGIAGNYCGSHLGGGNGSLYTIAYPQPGEQNGFGSTSASVPLPGFTPWRTVTVGETLAPIAETTVSFDVVQPLYEPSRQYQYGKGTWSWIIKMDSSCNYDEQKRYIDFAADMGYSTVLVDALWDTQIGHDKVAELARYAKSRNVALFLWYNSNGSWNDAPQGPRGIMNDIVARRREMKWMQQNGIRGIKVDFFGGDKQETMRLYHDILADANDYGILVIFHGCTLPRGWDRMYPNFASAEAVLASENLFFSQGSCDAEAFNATMHPLVRNTVASMDFGGSALNKYWNAENEPNGSRRVTSDVFALATAVLFQSPVQHFALAPNNLTDAPAWAIDFMKTVPTLWDDTRFIDGYPGRYLIMERKHGNDYYIVGVNAADETVKTYIDIPSEMRGQTLKLYSDTEKLEGAVVIVKPDKKGRIRVMMPHNGAFVLTNRIK